jgi:hypothetical protein
MWDSLPFKIHPEKTPQRQKKTAKSLGVRIKMVTGDHVAIAKEIARMVGLETNIKTASNFIDNQMNRPPISSKRQTVLPKYFLSTNSR